MDSRELNTKALGTTGMEISRVGLGGWVLSGDNWAFAWGPQDDRLSIATVRRAVECGVNWIDTAAAYGLGHSEELVARALSGVPEGDRPFVFSKCGLVEDSTNLEYPLRRVGRPAGIRQELEASLRRLRVDRIDLYMMHWPPDDKTPIDDYWGALIALRDEGKIRAAGLSNHGLDQIARAETIGHVDAVQPRFSVIRRRAAIDAAWADDHGTGVIVYSPMHSGLLSGGFSAARAAALPDTDWRTRHPDFTGEALRRHLELADALRPMAERRGVIPGVIAIAWTLAWRGVTGAIVGARSPEQVDQWIEASSIELSETELDALAAAISSTGAGEGPSRPHRSSGP